MPHGDDTGITDDDILKENLGYKRLKGIVAPHLVAYEMLRESLEPATPPATRAPQEGVDMEIQGEFLEPWERWGETSAPAAPGGFVESWKRRAAARVAAADPIMRGVSSVTDMYLKPTYSAMSAAERYLQRKRDELATEAEVKARTTEK